MIGHFFLDLRYACRSLRNSFGFAAAAVLTLALGIGANSAIFSVVRGVLLAPLPFIEPDRLVVVRENSLTLKREMSVSYPDFQDWQRNSRSFQQIAGIVFQGVDLTSPGSPEHLDGEATSAGFFSTLGVKLMLGRDFSLAEDRRHGAPVAIISNRLWRDRFASSTTALGRSITLNGIDYTIIGVLPREFRLWADATNKDVYLPIGQSDSPFVNDRTIHPGMECVARLKPGVMLSQARAEMDAVQDHLNQLYPAADRGVGTDIVPLKQEIVGDVGQTLLMLLGAVALVLLIACANVANLLLARSVGRARELAVRAALGASRARIASQLVAESVLLSLAGGVLGLLAAKWALSPALAVVAASLPRSGNIGVDIPVLLFTFGVSIVVGILFGLAPVLKSSTEDLHASLKEGGRGSAGGHHHAQHVLVVVQIALTLVLLTGASLLFRTIRNLWNVNPGFNTQHIVTFKVGLSPSLTKRPSSTRIAYQQLTERIRQIPGVQAADFTALVPLTHFGNGGPFWAGPQSPVSISEAPRAEFYWTGPDYVRTMEIPLLRGRYFTPEDTTKSDPVVVIDSVLAHAYYPDRDPVGQTITIPHWGVARIVGVVAHVRHWALDDSNLYTQNQIYASFNQLADNFVPAFVGDLTVTVRTDLSTAAVMPGIKAAVYGTGSGQAVYAVRSMRQIVSESMSSQRFPMILLSAFAGLALVLASVGIYGVISYSMTQRVREIGIRMALGAVKGEVLRMVISQGLGLAIAGIAIGIVVSLILTRALSSFSHLLYGVGASDPLTFIAVSLVLISAALLACYIPARRATLVDPMVALRHE
ncbi:MAG TPA: ABC transporter permease [Bryobacteraceae bacterium]|nr:ABC transporter permease [Bryobacteraceae bacterium]